MVALQDNIQFLQHHTDIDVLQCILLNHFENFVRIAL